MAFVLLQLKTNAFVWNFEALSIEMPCPVPDEGGKQGRLLQVQRDLRQRLGRLQLVPTPAVVEHSDQEVNIIILIRLTLTCLCVST